MLRELITHGCTPFDEQPEDLLLIEAKLRQLVCSGQPPALPEVPPEDRPVDGQLDGTDQSVLGDERATTTDDWRCARRIGQLAARMLDPTAIFRVPGNSAFQHSSLQSTQRRRNIEQTASGVHCETNEVKMRALKQCTLRPAAGTQQCAAERHRAGVVWLQAHGHRCVEFVQRHTDRLPRSASAVGDECQIVGHECIFRFGCEDFTLNTYLSVIVDR